ncbi:hypothetical protein Egran_03387 [Elaphomyces granulatus]|uniref:BZIP domain-containing protein n=1 Tax=Elaphomyces granulatus TaxID=519963 RepID=A0A232LYF4_9EURO|nr:hypothetical protein Egran_03387 [Elaphomyces granulatus]
MDDHVDALTSLLSGPQLEDVSLAAGMINSIDMIPQNTSKVPFISNIGFLRVFGGPKKTTRDGQPAKRRGPKPDSKPASTRRQELNRQAQRTHRERKEQYIRTLESEISRLREAYAKDVSSTQSSLRQHAEAMETLKAENDLLKEMLAARGIPYEIELDHLKTLRLAARPTGSLTGSPLVSHSALFLSSNTQPFSSPPSIFSGSNPSYMTGREHVDVSGGSGQSFQPRAYHASQNELPQLIDFPSRLDGVSGVADTPGIFEKDPQLAVDFILKLEEPCRDHTEMLCRKSSKESDDGGGSFSGHALMASCPPPSHIKMAPPDQMYPHQTYDIPTPNLETLLNLSRQLVTDSQLTPIMALQSIRNHELYPTLTREDVKIIIETLNMKIRCYGFGSVIEDFELRDCLSSVLSSKLDFGAVRLGDDAMYT